ncbi:MAG TPA: class I SAM-dependent methyltransferase [Chthoniobacterales bacterium]|jgi:predicted O-methyltransferase YrrM
MTQPEAARRSLVFSASNESRFWWHRLPRSSYIPPIFASLSDEEWELMAEWFRETTRQNLIGECVVPIMSLLHGLVMGSGIQRIVQLGTHAGYSSLLLGFYLRQMQAKQALFSFEIDEPLCRFAREWIDRAGLGSLVRVELRSSLDSAAPTLAKEYLGGAPELIFLDSSHEYRQTLDELSVWYPALAPGGLLVLHDTSEFAVSFDITQQGGVQRALREWCAAHPQVEVISLNHRVTAMETPGMVYQDFCGVGLIQKSV